MIDHFRLLAPIYDAFIPPPDPEQLQSLLRLPSGGTLLDAGGGTGRVAAVLHGSVERLVLSDESLAMLKQAREKGLRMTAVAPAEQLPFGEGTFARVLVVDALHHFADQQQAIAEFVRVLAPGGRLVIQEPDLNRLAVKVVALAEKVALMRSRFYRPHEIAQMVATYGLQPQIVTGKKWAAWVVADKVGTVDER